MEHFSVSHQFGANMRYGQKSQYLLLDVIFLTMLNIQQLLWHPRAFILKRKSMLGCCGDGKTHVAFFGELITG